MIRLYNVLRKSCHLSDSKETKLLKVTETEEVVSEKVDENTGLNKALDTYRKLIEKKGGKDADPLTEKEQDSLEEKIHIRDW